MKKLIITVISILLISSCSSKPLTCSSTDYTVGGYAATVGMSYNDADHVLTYISNMRKERGHEMYDKEGIVRGILLTACNTSSDNPVRTMTGAANFIFSSIPR